MVVAVSDQCRCVSCDFCHGAGTVHVYGRYSIDGTEREECEECYGSGISEECDYCRDQRELDEDAL